MGSNDKHNGVLHTTRQIPSVAGGPRYRNKQGRKPDGSRITNVAEQNVHRGPNGCVAKKTAATQTWVDLQTYFTNKWLERKQYLATTAKQSRFKDTELLAQETAAAEEEGQTQAMLFTMIQEQHAK